MGEATKARVPSRDEIRIARLGRRVEELERENARVKSMLKWERERRFRLFPDKCEVCHGIRGGVPGNENRVGGKILCDYCSADVLPGRTSA